MAVFHSKSGLLWRTSNRQLRRPSFRPWNQKNTFKTDHESSERRSTASQTLLSDSNTSNCWTPSLSTYFQSPWFKFVWTGSGGLITRSTTNNYHQPRCSFRNVHGGCKWFQVFSPWLVDTFKLSVRVSTDYDDGTWTWIVWVFKIQSSLMNQNHDDYW